VPSAQTVTDARLPDPATCFRHLQDGVFRNDSFALLFVRFVGMPRALLE